MRVYSFIDNYFELKKVEVEVSLLSGLPDMKILGLPDAVIKESVERIKSAIKFQGYQWPKAQKILVQLKPSDIRKSSRGLDLAIAAGVLAEMGQVELPREHRIFYGELSLKGRVTAPSDVEDIQEKDLVLTGSSTELPFHSLQIEELSQLESPEFVRKRSIQPKVLRPKIEISHVSSTQAKILSIVGAGEHHTLFVGAPGSGKTTSAEIVASSLLDPPEREFRESHRIWRRLGEKLNWRPIILPHHTSSHIAMVGGGRPPHPGEITRAHGGTLILDELLEFRKTVQESLREPIEKGRIRVSRSHSCIEFPSDFLLLATSNLCPCGHFLPEKNHNCQCRHQKLLTYLEKFSGPILDRFAITVFSSVFGSQANVPTETVRTSIQRARTFALKARDQRAPNRKISIEECQESLKGSKEEEIWNQMAEGLSIRRKHALLRVARTVADLEQRELIELSDLEQARALAVTPYRSLQSDVFKYI